MKIRKLTALLLTLCMIFSLSVAAFATEPEAHTIYDSAPDEEATVSAETTTSGTIPGSKIKWELNEHNWLTISGSGDCEPFTSKDDQPWAAVRDQITQVWFDDMDALHITDLAYWFEDCVHLTTAEIPSTTPTIGKHAFYNCPKLSTLTIYYGEDILESIGEEAFWRENDSGDTLYIGYIIGYPKSSVPFYDYDWAGSNRNNKYFYDLYGVYSDTPAAVGIMSAPGISVTSTGSIIGNCPSCGKYSFQGTYVEVAHSSRGHANYNECNSCHYVQYLGTYTTKSHGSGAYGSGTCPDCGSHTTILNDQAAITENMNEIAFAVSDLLGSGIADAEQRIADDFAASSADQYEIVNPYEDERINNVNLFISQYCAYRDTDVAAISLEDMKQLLRTGIGELYDYTYEDETREVEETVLNEDGEEVTELREVTVRVYTLTYRGEAYFADSIFHLTAEQKTLAQNFAENLSLFLGDGLFQNLSSSESRFTIPALGDIRYTDGSTEVVYYNQLDERYANKPYGTDNIGGYGCGPTCMAMVVSSLTDDLVDPVEMAKWSYEHGYWCSGSGSYHALIPAAAEAWGLPVSGCTASEPQRITDALSSSKLVVAIMSAGHFTSSGHFIVLRGVQDEKILVADPASRTRSEQSWDLSIILNEASKAAGSGGPFWIIG